MIGVKKTILPKEQEAFLTYLDALPGSFYVVDLHNQFYFGNKAQLNVLGLGGLSKLANKAINSANFDINDMGCLAVTYNNQMVFRHKKPCEFLEEVVVFGKRRFYLSFKAPLYAQDGINIIGYYGYSIDVTKFDKPLEALRSEASFLCVLPAIGSLSTDLLQLLIQHPEIEFEALPTSRVSMNFITKHFDFMTLLNSFPGNFYIEDLQGDIVFASQGHLAVRRNSNIDEVVDEEKSSALSDASRRQMRENNKRVIQCRKAFEFVEEPVIFGEQHYYVTHKAPLYDVVTDKVIGVCSYSVDITDQKKTLSELQKSHQSLKRAMESQSRFIAKLSHDIRTPFAGLMGMIDLMVSNPTDPRLPEYGDCARTSIQELIRYFEKIVQAEKVFNQEVLAEHQTVHLFSFLQGIVSIYQPIIKVKGLSVELDCAKDVSIQIAADVLATILMNLVANAVKYTVTGGVVIKADCRTEKNQSTLSIVVRDSGPGIDYALRDKIFDPFYRIHATSDNDTKGAGLGLAIAKRSAKKLQGTLRLLPSSSSGAAFECCVPVQRIVDAPAGEVDFSYEDALPTPNQEAAIASSLMHGVQEKPEDCISIVLVEDNAVVAFAITSLLRLHYPKAHVVHYDCAQSLLDACVKGDRPDLALIDIGLPDMSGDQLALQLRNRGYVQPRTALLAVTGHGHEQSHHYTLSAFDEVLLKPLSLEQLKVVLHRYLSYEQYIKLTKRSEVIEEGVSG